MWYSPLMALAFDAAGIIQSYQKSEVVSIYFAGVTEVLLVIALAALLAVALARPQNGYGVPTPSSAPAKYDFNYAVNDPPSGNDFGHQEARDGPNTQGSYYVLLPDGRLQRVTYTVNGDSGYLADVTYEGEASTPRPYTPAPQYSPLMALAFDAAGIIRSYQKSEVVSICFAGVTEVLLVIALAALLAVALARPQNGYGVPTPSSAPAKYDFNYAVNDPPSGNDFGHQEARDGPNTQGSYYVLLPDGRLQRVTYTVNGDSGYLADVTYEGEASTPRPYTPAPQYA
ncbi:cuticle protein 19.8-like [Penaeus chinensis]|uniref:cuticle protein 19.8-like n=1 Tax=Penaeus chinensis TaxID=139456 RepID=UPI001FB5FC5E|nr:cuticle protein 19.8-like [Penaeus chinensis]